LNDGVNEKKYEYRIAVQCSSLSRMLKDKEPRGVESPMSKTGEKNAGSKTSATGAFARGIAVLDEIVAHGPLRFAELEEALSVPKASLHRALNDLILERLIQFDDHTLTYSSGFRILELANHVWSRSDIRSLARDQLESLSELSGETAQLAVMADTHAVYIDTVESNNNVRMSINIGSKIPVYCSGTGKVLLAWLSRAEQKAIVDRLSFVEFTPSTITRPAKLAAELKKIRQSGFACDNEEHYAGICCVAAPIVNRSNEAVAAVSITAPTFRIETQQLEQWQAWVMAAAQTISGRLAPVARE